MRISPLITAVFALLLSGAASAPPSSVDRSWLGGFTANRLERFQNAREFQDYLAALSAAVQQHGGRWMPDPEFVIWMGPPPRPPTLAGLALPQDTDLGGITRTGATVRDSDYPSRFKRIGRYLVILQDSRLYTVDLLAQSGLAVVDQRNMYRNASSNERYDDLLVSDRQIIVHGTDGLSGNKNTLAVYSLGENGVLVPRGRYEFIANDWIGATQFAARIEHDQLVLYQQVWLDRIDPASPMPWPELRQSAIAEREATEALLSASDVYRPTLGVADPAIHVVSVCPVAPLAQGGQLRCVTKGIVAPRESRLFVNAGYLFLWSATYLDCPTVGSPPPIAPGAVLYRVSLATGDVVGVRTRGYPLMGNSFFATDDDARIVTTRSCGEDHSQPVDYARIESSDLDAEMHSAPASRYLSLQPVASSYINVLMTSDATAIVALNPFGPNPMALAAPHAPGRVVVIANQEQAVAQVLTVPHDITSTQIVGHEVVVVGYETTTGLHASLIDLMAPQLAATIAMPSHYDATWCCASNAISLDRDNALFGLPTGSDASISAGWRQEADDADISIISISAGRLHLDGDIELDRTQPDNLSDCASGANPCVEWYGNATPIFVGGRVFALIAHDLVEAQLRDRQLHELRRLHLSTVRHVWTHK